VWQTASLRSILRRERTPSAATNTRRDRNMSVETIVNDYDVKVQQQIDQYVTEAIHDLPEIFHVWSHHFIRPGFLEVFGVESVNDFYFEACREASDDFSRPFRILSVGCGDGTVETELANALRSRVSADFRLDGADLSPVLIDRFRETVRENHLSDWVFPKVEDLNLVAAGEQYEVVMANHSLHHIMDLEKIFEFIWRALTPGGIFATSDMIGRNGHMRWPETEAVLQAIWPLLSEKQRFNHQLLKSHLERFEDFDCSHEGFEGIRAQDILYLILNRFSPYKFFGYGGFVEVLVDRGFGHGFDAKDERDQAFITAFAKINEMMLDGGMIKPTIMTAYFTKDERSEVSYHGRTARKSLRLPFETPSWVQYERG
jgi:2-polyprenyl-3-methyl-5-hydroxy-6-metoxy-1,4-benzoquinol methylase